MAEAVIDEPEVKKVLLGKDKGPAPEPPVIMTNISDVEKGLGDKLPEPKPKKGKIEPSEAKDPTPPPPPPLGFRDQDKPPPPQQSASIIGNYIPICKHFVGTLWWNIMYAVFSIIPICMIYLGISRFHYCPASRFIPIYLVVGGIFLLASQIIRWLELRNKVILKDEDKTITLEVMVNAVTIFWLVVGSVWVYKMYTPNYDPRKGEYCDKFTYLFTLIIVTVGYISVAIGICMCCFICIAVFMGKQAEADPIPVVIANQ